MKNKRQHFTKALGIGIVITLCIFQTIGVVVYLGYAQFTQPLLVNNLDDSFGAWLIRTLYFVGMTIGFTLHVGPITGMIETLRQEDQFHSKDTLDAESHLRSFALRSCIAIIVALLGH